MESTTTYGVTAVDRVRSDLLGSVLGTGADALAPASGRTAPLTGGPRIAPIATGAGGGLRPQRDDDRSAGRGGCAEQGFEPDLLGGRDRRSTTSTNRSALVVAAVSGGPRHLRSCGTPVPGSAPSDTAA